MPELILHHYPASPFSEKVRLVLGFKGLAWRSVTIPTVMPKPDVVALTGGNRRTPLLQIGSDIYCDTGLICRVLERLAPRPTLFPQGDTLAVAALSHFGDHVFVGVRTPISAMGPQDLQAFFSGADEAFLKQYRADRASMRKGGGTEAKPAAEYRSLNASLVPRLEAQLADGRPFLLGDAACIADFSVYHTCWVIARIPGLAVQLEQFPRIKGWMARMKAFGHGRSTDLSSAEALEIARAGQPAGERDPVFIAADGLARGDTAEVTPTDYAFDPVRGELLDCSEDHVSLRRTDPRAGTVVVHFPRAGYQLRKAGTQR